MFANLEAAPQELDVTPEKPSAKRQDTTRVISGFWGVTNLPLVDGQQPATTAVLMGLSRRDQESLKDMPVNSYGQTGENFLEAWTWRTFNGTSKCRGKQWQKGIGVEEPLALCKGPGAMIKHAINEIRGKMVAQAAAEYLGVRLAWQVSGYYNKKNKVTFLIINRDGGRREALFYGNPTYVLKDSFDRKWPDVDLKRREVRANLRPLCSGS